MKLGHRRPDSDRWRAMPFALEHLQKPHSHITFPVKLGKHIGRREINSKFELKKTFAPLAQATQGPV
ncbi:hypothetical protein [Burkholderia sp. WP9]|uniref:hypothetical protein n=1 Tax=Burkholderia sp. WP9 TaxID=1500263 RepID=UPI00115F92EE|nr:hypothetical protein [Burkholderia sp. WP9]